MVDVLLAIYALGSVSAGIWFTRRALSRTKLIAEEVVLAFAFAYPIGGALWLRAFLHGETFLGFDAPWTWLTAAHFHAAGFGAWTVAAWSARLVPTSARRCRRLVVATLLLHPIPFSLVAAGLNGVAHADEAGTWAFVIAFAFQFVGVTPWIPRTATGALLLLALATPLLTMIPALTWALGGPLLSLDGMIAYHGIVNAALHVGCGWLALAIIRPAARAEPRRPAADSPDIR